MIRFDGLRVTYRDRPEPTLVIDAFEAQAGEAILLAGPSGSGKSTLLNCLNGALIHENDARIEGRIQVNNQDLAVTPMIDICRRIGSVFQNPDTQILAATVEEEVAFGLENMRLDGATIDQRIDESLALVGLQDRRGFETSRLSGGQKQRLAIAAAIARRPQVALLDEPISQLDSQSAREIRDALGRLRRDHDITMIIGEHRLEEMAPLVDRVVLIDAGKIALDQPVARAFDDLAPYQRLGLGAPSLMELFEKLGRPERPLSPEQAPEIMAPSVEIPSETSRRQEKGGTEVSPEITGRVKNVYSRYARKSPWVLQSIDLSIHRGDRIAVMGPNGSGKSTLLLTLAGLLPPSRGSLQWEKNGGQSPVRAMTPQQPDLTLFEETVAEEIAFAPRQRKRPPQERREIARDVAARLGLIDHLEDAPFSLSKGQRLRVAIGSILSMKPDIAILDEPSTGQDRLRFDELMRTVLQEVDQVIFGSHDLDIACRYARRLWILKEGRIIFDGPVEDAVFDEELTRRASIHPNAFLRWARSRRLPALTPDQAVKALGKEAPL